MVVVGSLVRTLELAELVTLVSATVLRNNDVVTRHLFDNTGSAFSDHDDVTGVNRGVRLHTGSDDRGFRTEERHRLTLHVGAHERAVCVVVLEERNERRCNRHHLARGNVHVVDAFARNGVDLSTLDSNEYALFDQLAVGVDRCTGLRDNVLVLVAGGQVVDLVRDLAGFNATVRGFDEPERVDAREGRERPDQADVRAFRGFDGTHAAVVRRVNVADLNTGALTRQSTRSERRQTALVGESRERVVLVHELRELRCSEELLDRGGDGTDVDERLGRDCLDVLRGHALTNDALHARKTRADLVLNQFANGANSTVTEVVDVVDVETEFDVLSVTLARDGLLALVQSDEVLDRRGDVREGQGRLGDGKFDSELAVELVAAHLRKVESLRVEVEVVEE